MEIDRMRELIIQKHLRLHRDRMLMELRWSMDSINASKDILVVVHNQLEYVKKCLESIRLNTSNYTLYVWDNASNTETKNYLRSLSDIILVESDTNIGFGEPNNRLAAMGQGDYLILLNSDTIVFPQWSDALLGFLQHNPDYAQVGYLGGLLDENGRGGRAVWGSKIDYVMGFCSCNSRQTYREWGLFDPMYEFAYCEDADFSLRLQSHGKQIYALHLMLVHHYENKTIKSVVKEGTVDVTRSFNHNHEILRTRWDSYLKHQRIDVRYP